MSAAIDRLLRERRLIVCVGPGGVGKTTTAAALGVRAALLGIDTLVLTVDPARRLATALGLDALGDAAQPVPLAGLAALAGAPAPGRLDAAMLEVGDAHDALIRRIAAPEAAARIFESRVYRIMSRTLWASHAYAAIERLGDALAAERRLVILDTPPTRNALDILDAPGRLLAFLDEGVLTWLEGQGSGDRRSRLRAGGDLVARAARRLLARVAGASVVADLGEFLGLFIALRPGFVARARAIEAALRGPECGFVVVTSALEGNLADAGFLAAGLRERGVHPEALLCNRAFIPAPPAPASDGGDDPLLALAEDPGERAELGGLRAAIEALRARVLAGNARARVGAQELAATLGGVPLALAPVCPREPQDVAALAELAAAIVDG